MSSRPSRPAGPAEILEQGDIFFFHRPGRTESRNQDGEELEDFFLVLHPLRQRRCRMLTLGKRRLPPPLKSGAPGRGGERLWGRIEGLFDTSLDLRSALGSFRP